VLKLISASSVRPFFLSKAMFLEFITNPDALDLPGFYVDYKALSYSFSQLIEALPTFEGQKNAEGFWKRVNLQTPSSYMIFWSEGVVFSQDKRRFSNPLVQCFIAYTYPLVLYEALQNPYTQINALDLLSRLCNNNFLTQNWLVRRTPIIKLLFELIGSTPLFDEDNDNFDDRVKLAVRLLRSLIEVDPNQQLISDTPSFFDKLRLYCSYVQEDSFSDSEGETFVSGDPLNLCLLIKALSKSPENAQLLRQVEFLSVLQMYAFEELTAFADIVFSTHPQQPIREIVYDLPDLAGSLSVSYGYSCGLFSSNPDVVHYCLMALKKCDGVFFNYEVYLLLRAIEKDGIGASEKWDVLSFLKEILKIGRIQLDSNEKDIMQNLLLLISRMGLDKPELDVFYPSFRNDAVCGLDKKLLNFKKNLPEKFKMELDKVLANLLNSVPAEVIIQHVPVDRILAGMKLDTPFGKVCSGLWELYRVPSPSLDDWE
jgi:hypothetical protein